MFSPDPNKAQEPVFLAPGQTLCVRLKPNAPQFSDLMKSTQHCRDIFQAKEIRWRAGKGEIKVTFNTNPHTPAEIHEQLIPKFFQAGHGEFAVHQNAHSVFFTATETPTKLYLEVG